ncbi:MAG: hypothetical protein R2764_20280 [Bacteroidales bacterium]
MGLRARMLEAEGVEVDVRGWDKGLYYVQYVHGGTVLGAGKVVVR